MQKNLSGPLKKLIVFFHSIDIILPLIVFTLSSCTAYYFERPQPVDATNIYEFPKKFRGKFLMDKGDTITIGKNYLMGIDREEAKVINGIYPTKPGAQKYFRSLQRINFDSLNQPIDTVVNYIIKYGKIYEIKSPGELAPGYSYRHEGDTIVYEKIDTVGLKLGQDAFLREISKNTYALNFRGHDEEYVQLNWWILIVFSITPDGNITWWSFNDPKGDNTNEIYSHDQDWGSDTHYLNSNWTRQNIMTFLNDEDSLRLMKIDKNKKR